MTIAEIVSDYIQNYRQRAASEVRHFRTQPSATRAIQLAALCIAPNGKRQHHQRRIPKAVLSEAEVRLQVARGRLAKARDFLELYGIVKHEIGDIRGIGELTVYDISQRIGAYFDKEPTVVYLHAGARTGAAVLGFRDDQIDPSALPSDLRRLKPYEIEDCLCIYKSQFQNPKAKQAYPTSEADRNKGYRASGCITTISKRQEPKRGGCYI